MTKPFTAAAVMQLVGRGQLALDEKGEVVLCEWTAAHPVTLDRKGKRSIKGLSILGRDYRRAR